jgi:hypothetical protein
MIQHSNEKTEDTKPIILIDTETSDIVAVEKSLVLTDHEPAPIQMMIRHNPFKKMLDLTSDSASNGGGPNNGTKIHSFLSK